MHCRQADAGDARPAGGVVDADVDDAYLVRRAQDGYLDAYSALVVRHGGRAYRVAVRMLGNREDAQDVAQEALVAAWQQLPGFRQDANFTTWLYSIVTRRCLNRINRTKPTASLDLLADVADDEADPARSAERDFRVDAVANAIAALPPAQRAVVVLHHLEDLSYLEVARITGSTEPAVRSHLFRARRTLGKTLAEWR
jgi:RNA polymerase sigma-70 factor (ECF subfamily)